MAQRVKIKPVNISLDNKGYFNRQAATCLTILNQIAFLQRK
jgi:hypothetical protein